MGSGWNLEEMADHGVPVKKRRAVLAEYLAVMQSLWTQETASFSGEYVNLSPSWAWPKPIRKPHLPVLVGAFGNERLFRWVAKSADGWITTPIEQGLAESALDTYHDLGIDEVMLAIPDKSADEAVDAIAQYATLIDRYRE